MSDHDPDSTWRRERATQIAFDSIAEALVRGQRPGDQHFGLMVVPLLDAFRSDDRPRLCLIRELTERLLNLIPEDTPWSADLEGRLAGLLVAAELGNAVLVVEHFGDSAS